MGPLLGIGQKGVCRKALAGAFRRQPAALSRLPQQRGLPGAGDEHIPRIPCQTGQPAAQLFHALPCLSRKGKHLFKAGPQVHRAGAQISFVAYRDPAEAFAGLQNLPVLLVQRPGAVEHANDQLALLGALLCFVNADPLRHILRLPQPRRIRKAQHRIAAADHFGDHVPGGARLTGDDGPVIAGQGVEQRGFARIGLA